MIAAGLNRIAVIFAAVVPAAVNWIRWISTVSLLQETAALVHKGNLVIVFR